MRLTAKAILAPLVTLAVVAGLHAQIRSYAAADDTTVFQDTVRTQMAEYPVRIGDWDGVDIKLPAAAQQLLRPNVLFARKYVNSATGRRASVLVVHCSDSRDMQGHYPPNCYPGNGWTMQGAPRVEPWSIWGLQVPVADYRFKRRELNEEAQQVVLNFFILPDGRFVTDMESVRRASGDYRLRPYGAAQFQVVFDGSSGTDAERRAIAMELFAPLAPVVQTLTTSYAKQHVAPAAAPASDASASRDSETRGSRPAPQVNP